MTFKGVTISDNHFGHKRTPASKMAENFKKYLYPIITDIDVLFITGDFWDRYLSTTSEDYRIGVQVLVELCVLSKQHDFKILALKGTPGHDYEQMAILRQISSSLRADALYVNEVLIQRNGPGGYSYLYIPDEIDDNTEITKDRVKSLMLKMGMSKVDFVLMHGSFEHQFPKGIKGNYHDFDFYNSITNYAVFCGHIHEHSVKGKIIVPGSSDSTTFADKKPKGFIKWVIENKKLDYRFVPNKGQQIYKTVELKSLESDYVLKTVAKAVHGLTIGSWVKVTTKIKGSHISQFEPTLKEKYPDLKWVFEEKKTKEVIDFTKDVVMAMEYINITPNNIVEMVDQTLQGKGITDTKRHIEVLGGYI